ncbi:MAG: hypothetical protein EOP09_19115 [Proteobacteria bacterium]|nr:MAG: hypothetical protein EOP09_19115 [Pseudomonadota bacterium]
MGVFYSGVHATIAGVILGLITPYQFNRSANEKVSYSPVEDLMHQLHPFISFGIMPVFALANAGVALRGIELGQVFSHRIHLGVALGLIFGKPFGILLLSWVSVKMRLANLPEGIRWVHIAGVGCLGGVGFTMALFIANLALLPQQEVYAKTAIILGSLVSGTLGAIVLRRAFASS